MDMDRLRDSYKEAGVKSLWGGQMAPEVKEAWLQAQAVLEKEYREKLDAL